VTPGKREVIGRDVGQLKGIKISGRIIDEITGEALVGATIIPSSASTSFATPRA
jgi:hypothetical protein